MDSKLFKAFTPYVNTIPNVDLIALLADLETQAVQEPSPSQWGSVGFCEVMQGEFYIDVQGRGQLACLQFNEKILPATVIKEKMHERIAKIELQDGRKLGKKAYAEIKEDVVLELLPTAFIRRKLVPVLFVDDYVFVFTSSAKKADDAISMCVLAIADDRMFAPGLLINIVKGNVVGQLTTLAKEGQSVDDEKGTFVTASDAVLKGENKQSIRVKDKDVASDDIQRLLKQEYTVHQLGLQFWDDGGTDAEVEFMLNDRLVFSRFTLAEVKDVREKDAKDAGDTFLATAWLVSVMAGKVMSLAIDVMGGISSLENEKAEKKVVSAASIDDDDEL